ncbi:hypothetical protein EGT74_04610 [Chitinophaga lutea]|uniref:Outer membrane protein beta-barrel domain-containing protein n=1 Tax=Chitinophaga lutea TaxID=2488634 RepID=A0A3N4Q5M7_9BACT|nr:hypothetical protein [Chitinophaga lutea]RPE12831.1 hypothetical protein EGT74_04610 [Chitinophaga lutea]
MKKVHLFLMALPVLALVSCSRDIYVPNQVNVPLLKEKNEFKANLSLSNWQAAYAITDNIAVMVNGQYVYRNWFYSDNSNNTDNDDLFVDRNTRGGVLEGGVGFFKPVDSKKRAVFDVYAGFGQGAFKTLDGAYNEAPEGTAATEYQLRTRFTKFFVQPSFGLAHKVVEAAFTSRFSLVKFNSQTMGPKAFENDPDRRANFMRLGDRAVPFFEPTFTVRAGYRYIKWYGQLLFSVPLNDEQYNNYNVNDYFQPVSVTMGVTLNFGQWVKDAGRR